MVTSEIKDKILNDILDQQEPHVSINPVNDCEKYGITPFYMLLVLEQFHDMRLIQLVTSKDDDVDVFVKMAAGDHRQQGGFVVKDEIVKASLERLQLEILSLQKSSPEKASLWAAMAANVTAVATALSIHQ